MNSLRQIGSYRIESSLGSGRYAQVYRAFDAVRKRMVALKILKPDLFDEYQAWERFLAFAQLAADLVHPRLAWVWEAGEADGLKFIAERFVNGPTLAACILQPGALPIAEALPIIRQIIQGLDFAHSRGWVHGDIHPRNILLSPKHGAVVTDFGLMRALQSCHLAAEGGMLLGTPQYRAPEIWRGENATPASDQYALACVLGEMLSGKRLFEAPSLDETKEKHLTSSEGLRPWAVLVPWQIVPVLERALAHNPSERYPSLGEFIDEAERAFSQASSPEERMKLETEAQIWRAAQEALHRQEEEAARQAEVAKARREIEEQLQSTSEGYSQLEIEPVVQTVQRRKARRPATLRRRGTPWRWLAWLGLGTLVLVTISLWLMFSLPGGIQLIHPATATIPPTTLTPTSIPTQTQTATPSATPTASLSPTLSATPSPTPQPSLTASHTPTTTPTATASPTRTKTPREREIEIIEPPRRGAAGTYGF